jgi:LPXTG-motif cell wall-anchored protein
LELKSIVKKGSLIAALGLGLSVSAVIPGNTAFAAENTNPAAQKLVDSLKALNIDQVDYLYAYLQSVNLSDQEFNSILSNTKQVSEILSGKNPTDLPKAQKVEISRLFLDSVKLAHLQATIVDDNGNSIDLSNYKAGTSGLQIELKDLKGKILATIDPKKEDLNPKALQAKINSLTAAIQAKKQLEKTGKFVPMPTGTLPNTATNNVDYMAIGGLLIILGGLAIVPAARLVRKSEDLAEA